MLALSQSVAGALKKGSVEDTVETICFVEMIDHFFDCLNVNNFSSKNKIKLFQSPYIRVFTILGGTIISMPE